MTEGDRKEREPPQDEQEGEQKALQEKEAEASHPLRGAKPIKWYNTGRRKKSRGEAGRKTQ